MYGGGIGRRLKENIPTRFKSLIGGASPKDYGVTSRQCNLTRNAIGARIFGK